MFENEDASPFYMTEKMLKKYLDDPKILQKDIEFVFVASCHSENISRLFHKLKVRHVICIKEEDTINDKA
jgi:hypothetical protein